MIVHDIRLDRPGFGNDQINLTQIDQDTYMLRGWSGACEDIHRGFTDIGGRYTSQGVRLLLAATSALDRDGNSKTGPTYCNAMECPRKEVARPLNLPGRGNIQLVELVLRDFREKGWKIVSEEA